MSAARGRSMRLPAALAAIAVVTSGCGPAGQATGPGRHALDEAARVDRTAWLLDQLDLD